MHKQEALLVKTELEELVALQNDIKEKKMKQLEERKQKAREAAEATIAQLAEIEDKGPDKRPPKLQIEVEEAKESKSSMMEFLGKQLTAKSKELENDGKSEGGKSSKSKRSKRSKS